MVLKYTDNKSVANEALVRLKCVLQWFAFHHFHFVLVIDYTLFLIRKSFERISWLKLQNFNNIFRINPRLNFEKNPILFVKILWGQYNYMFLTKSYKKYIFLWTAKQAKTQQKQH